MLATVAANDFGYITVDDLVERNLRTLETLVGSNVSKAIFLIGTISTRWSLCVRAMSPP